MRKKTRIRILSVASIFFFVAASFAFCITAYLTSQHPRLKIDTTIFAWLQSLRSITVTRFLTNVTFFGSRYFLFPCYTILVIYYLFFQKKLWFAVVLSLTGFLGNQLLFFMQTVLHRRRPADPLIDYVNGYGYPSGHSFASFVFAGLLSFMVCQKPWHTKWKLACIIVLFLVASLIAASRAYLHVHYPTDVLGGFYLSIVWLIPCLWILYLVDKMYR